MKRFNDCSWAMLFAVAAVGFALTAHRDAWIAWRWAFLALAGIAICGGWVVLADPIGTIVGKWRGNRLGWWIALAVGLAVFAAVAYRRLLHEDYVPSSLHWFALVAVGIGATEELLWRGWMQGSLARTLTGIARHGGADGVPLLRRSSADCEPLPGAMDCNPHATACKQAVAHVGSLVAILAAAGSHTAYKTALFAFPPDGIVGQTPGGLLFIAGLTFGFGAVLGLLRLRQGTIAAPLAFHTLFDLLVYGQYASAPWWVL